MVCLSIAVLTTAMSISGADHCHVHFVRSQAIELCSFVFGLIFLVEMMLKLIGLGMRGYVRDRANIFDGTIVTVNLIELVVSTAGGKQRSPACNPRVLQPPACNPVNLTGRTGP